MLPQELVDTIVAIVDVDDKRTLKALALVPSTWCAATQPILFRSLTLKGRIHPSNYMKASKLLTGSLHLGTYVKELTLELPLPSYLEGRTAVAVVLAMLTAVRRFIVDGGDKYPWDDFCDTSLVEFVSRQPLEFLRFRAIRDIPLSVFISSISPVSALSCSSVTLRDITDAVPGQTCRSSITDLVLDQGTQDISRLLSPPGYSLPLRRLTVRDGLSLIPPAARTLYYLRIGAPTDTPSLDWTTAFTFPSLISFEIETVFEDCPEAWMRDSITAILRSKAQGGQESRYLEEIVITYLPIWEHTFPGDLYTVFLGQLDDALSSHIPHPRLRWRLRFVGTGREDRFATLVGFITAQMPVMDALGRLNFETYEPNKWTDEFL
ncbi:hypothetical protein C8R45DRAFT_627465 [Mycena sanguinolenta]|nr:hypothetical protein C8R45DRAFT_627465 [Mycena sanguinolenta]